MMPVTRFSLSLALLGFATLARAQVPYVFTPGTPARATEVNSNFNYLSNQITAKVSASSGSGAGNSPVDASFTMFAPVATVTVTALSQKVLVVSGISVWTNSPTGSQVRDVNICAHLDGQAGWMLTPANPLGLQLHIPGGIGLVMPISLSGIATNLAPGVYQVGLCGSVFLNGEATLSVGNGYTTAVLINQ